MVQINVKPILDKFKELREKEEQIFDVSKLAEKGFRSPEDIVFDAYYDFSQSLENEINSLPFSGTTLDLLQQWIGNLDYWIRSKNGAKLSEASKIHLKYRKELKEKLRDIAKPLSLKVFAEKEKEEELVKSENKENLTLKQQILLLKVLGLFEKEEIMILPYTKQAKLFSYLLNRSTKTVKDLISNIGKKDPDADFFLFKDENVNTINNLLESVDLQEYKIKL